MRIRARKKMKPCDATTWTNLHQYCDNHQTNQSVIASEHLLNGSIGSQPGSRCVRILLGDANGYLTADDARSRRQDTAVLHLAVLTPVRAPIRSVFANEMTDVVFISSTASSSPMERCTSHNCDCSAIGSL